MLAILPAHDEPMLSHIRVLFREYAESLGFHLCFQDFDREMAELPGQYRPPMGRLLVATWSGEVAGCVAMKPLGEGLCEMKRFFVRPAFRGKGIGQALAVAIINEARSAGYRAMRLDTVPSMQSAIRIYESLGFRDTEPYVFNPVPGVRYLELRLV
jgi:ribosomal protein S18 acetylase RimI-like enzyme